MVDEEDDQWRDFVKEIPYEKISERTEVRHEEFREQFRESFRNYMTREQEETTEAQKAQAVAQTVAVEALKNQTKLDYESWKKDLEDKAAAQAEASATQAEEQSTALKTALKLDYESWKQTIEDKNPDNILLLDTNIPKDNIFDMFFGSYDNDNSYQKEQLFKLKLRIFEQDIVKNSNKDDNLKNAKTFIRKAKSPMEVLLGYMVFSNTAELTMSEKEKFEVEGVYIPLK
jgi:hypothetical protein